MLFLRVVFKVNKANKMREEVDSRKKMWPLPQCFTFLQVMTISEHPESVSPCLPHLQTCSLDVKSFMRSWDQRADSLGCCPFKFIQEIVNPLFLHWKYPYFSLTFSGFSSGFIDIRWGYLSNHLGKRHTTKVPVLNFMKFLEQAWHGDYLLQWSMVCKEIETS